MHNRASNIVAKYSRSWKFSYTFRKQQEKFGTHGALITAVATRWNTNFDMFRSLTKNKEAAKKTCEIENTKSLMFTDVEWLIMELFVDWSKCITETIDFMQSDQLSRIDCAFARLYFFEKSALPSTSAAQSFLLYVAILNHLLVRKIKKSSASLVT